MKKTLFAAVLAGASFSAISAPYIGLEYGFGSTSHDQKSAFKSSPNVKLDPSNEDGILNGFIGYSLNTQWAIEVGYSQFNLDDSRSQLIDFTNTYKEEREWDADIKAKQFSLAPVYTYSLNDKWSAKFKAGLTYTQYDVSSSQSLEEEFHITDAETNKLEESNSSSSNKIGGLISIGTAYELYPQLTIGANVEYQFDRFANTASFNVGSTYYF